MYTQKECMYCDFFYNRFQWKYFKHTSDDKNFTSFKKQMLIFLAPELDLLWVVYTSSYPIFPFSRYMSTTHVVFTAVIGYFPSPFSMLHFLNFPINLHIISHSSTRAISICYLAAWENLFNYIYIVWNVVCDSIKL